MRAYDRQSELLNSTTTAIALNRLKAIRSAASAAASNTPRREVQRASGRGRRGLLAAALAVAVAVTGGVSVTAYSLAQSNESAHAVEAVTARRVQVVSPSRVAGGEIVLPATLRPYQTTEIFARTSGYLKAWHVDIGDHVTSGQLLAELHTPELDQELRQTEASLTQAQASVAEAMAEHDEAKQQIELAAANIARAEAQLALAKITYQRNKPLAKKEAISRQELDESEAVLHSREAEVTAAKADHARLSANLGTRAAIIRSREATVANAEANVQRLRELQGFQRLVAPFPGVITRRRAEVGMLVTAGTLQQTSLFSLVEQDKLRVQVDVPQSQASQIELGQQASILVPEHPGKTFAGTITRTSGSVDSRSRTLNVEIELPNEDNHLLPGAYAEVRLASQDSEKKLRIPASALLLKSSGTFAVAVEQDSSLRLLPIKLGRDHGNEVEVIAGLSGHESLVVNPPDDLTEGERVSVAKGAAE